ncbi:hypothetical protein [Armatimonas sp.]|uniref:hypothetical protein n=1 Tax=Armatimonas sp. TaxID=1872638 RepID=UPI0037506A53
MLTVSLPLLFGVVVTAAIGAGYRFKPKRGDSFREDLLKRGGLFAATAAAGYVVARPSYSALVHWQPVVATYEGADTLTGALVAIVALPVLLRLFETLPPAITDRILGVIRTVPAPSTTTSATTPTAGQE